MEDGLTLQNSGHLQSDSMVQVHVIPAFYLYTCPAEIVSDVADCCFQFFFTVLTGFLSSAAVFLG